MSQRRLLDPVDAARRAGLTAAGLAAHDVELQPIRTSSGRRLYTADQIDAWLDARAARRTARQG